MKQLKNEKAKVLSQAVAPIIKDWSDAPLLKFYNSLMEEIYSGNVVTEAYVVQNMMNQSMVIVLCAFEQEPECDEPASSIFA